MATSEQSGPGAGHDLRLPARYRLRRHLASGGMASVWCADDLVLGRSVAIKVLAERFAHDEIAMRRFKREARAAARVSTHAHVVTIFDVGDVEEDRVGVPPRPFIVMEYLAGGTVADAIRVQAASRRETVRWMREAAAALDHAHAQGIVHRDIKPANFLLNRGRVLHVADFGIARLVSEDTISGGDELFGTAAYLSPEQALGREATGASDRYALAVATFELLTGRRPFGARHFAAQARQHIADERPSASALDRTLPVEIDAVLRRGMARQPDERYRTAAAFVGALETALLGRIPGAANAPRRPSAARAPGAVSRTQTGRLRPAAPPVAALPPTATHDAVTTLAVPAAGAARPAPPVTAAPAVVGRRRDHRRAGVGARAVALTALVLVCGVAATLAVTGLRLSAQRTRHPSPARTLQEAIRAPAAPAATTPAAATRRRTHTRTTAMTTAAPAAPAAAAARPSTPVAAAVATGAGGAEQLQLTGHQEMVSGDYGSAIATLRRAVSAAPPGSLTYAYGLYDLGRSLYLAGNAPAAVQVLQRRMLIPNQLPVVQQALDDALQASGQAPAATSGQHSGATAGNPSGGAAVGGAAPTPAPGRGQSHRHPHGVPVPGGAPVTPGGAGRRHAGRRPVAVPGASPVAPEPGQLGTNVAQATGAAPVS